MLRPFVADPKHDALDRRRTLLQRDQHDAVLV